MLAVVMAPAKWPWFPARDKTGTAAMGSARRDENIFRRMQRVVRIAEAAAFDAARRTIPDVVLDVGTGFTVIKLRQPPLAGLVDRGLIGPDEIQAAHEIEQAWRAIDGRYRLKAVALDRIDGSRHSDMPWPATLAKTVHAYQSWAAYWSARRKVHGDPMLAVVTAVVIEELPIRDIALRVGRRHSVVEQGLACGLRHYAAWSGFVSGHVARQWLDAAEAVFARDRA